MKVIEPGLGYKREGWMGRTLSCKDCGCRFTLGPEDKALVKMSYDQRDGNAFSVACPSCKSVIWTDLGGASQQWDR